MTARLLCPDHANIFFPMMSVDRAFRQRDPHRRFCRDQSSGLVASIEPDGADQAGNGVLIGKDADHLASGLDLAIDTLERIGRVQLGAVRGREIGFSLIRGTTRALRIGTELVGDASPFMRRPSRAVASAHLTGSTLFQDRIETARQPCCGCRRWGRRIQGK
ncbi:hypothetical protein ABIB90_007478 [Bradyrhizobium sp. JR4.1]